MSNNSTVENTDSIVIVSLWKPINMFQIAFGCIGIVGNMFVCITVARKKTLQNLTNYFIASLAIADLISSTLWVLSVVSRLIPLSRVPTIRHFQCVVVEAGYPFWVAVLASTYHLVAITLERLCGIVYPVKHRLFFSRRLAAVCVALCYILPCIILVNFPLFHKVINGVCVYSTSPSSALSHGIFLFMFTYLLPLVVMTWAYIAIWKRLKNSTSQHVNLSLAGQSSQTSSNCNQGYIGARKKVIQMLIIVFLSFVICWTPDQIMVILVNIGVAKFHLSQFLPVQILALCNSCINPFIYAFKNRHFRDGFREIFCFGKTASNVRVGPSNLAANISETQTSKV
ncbi:allatostatin-A receptor-like [Saccoglossus kowalevskii]|uniref:Allatostatin-A receptor-like n=1 Tax=Saccoglossus kowalevskii TaxID=10224 RepID=A0ABM0N1C2_SACKO|nr:PREDICTED: allatostatin-A receptor-like [Saccoglossus kowalevskii]